MNKFVITLSVLLSLLVTPVIVEAEQNDEFYKTTLSVFKKQIRQQFKDPDSVKFKAVTMRLIRIKPEMKMMVTVCGDINAKNGFGGYTGYTGFVYQSKEIDASVSFRVEEHILREKTPGAFQKIYAKHCIGNGVGIYKEELN